MTVHKLDKQRLFIGIALFVSVFVLPSLLSLFLGALIAIRYNRYFELPLTGLLIDALYRPYGHTVIGLFGFSLLYILIIDHLRIRIRMRDDRRLY